MQTLVSIALGDLFPEQYRKWHAKKQNVRDVFSRERKSRKHSVAQDVTKTEGSLRSALREEVVNHVISLFPYCFHRFDLEYGTYLVLYRSLVRDGLSSHTQAHGDAEARVESRYTFDTFL